MNLRDRARAGARQRARLMAAGAAAVTAGLALMPGPAALAAPAPLTTVGCSAGDLAAAVSGASNGGVLTLTPRCKYILSSTLEVGVDLTIRGRDDTITAAPELGLLLRVDPGATVTADDLTMTDGAPAIYNAGTLTVTNSTFTQDTKAIVNINSTVDSTNGTLTVTNSRFMDNVIAIYSNADAAGVGGAYRASVIVTDSIFDHNISPGNGGAISVENSDGTLDRDSFTDNNAAAYGGAVENGCHNEGNDVICGTLTISGSTFSGNTAAAGGAIANFATLTVTRSGITANTALDSKNGYGGGLYNSQEATLTDSLISGNKARVDGGGIYNRGDIPPTLTNTDVISNNPDNCAPAKKIPGCTG